MNTRWCDLLVAVVAGLLTAGVALAEEPAPPASQPAGSQPDGTSTGVALPLKLPKPAFASTPKNIPPGTTVERTTGKLRPPFLAPAGAKNLAAGKKVVASDDAPVIGEIAFVTNGDKEAVDGSYVEFGPGLQHVTIDLGASAELHAVLVWHYHGDPRVYHDVIVQASDDPGFAKGVTTLFNNDHDNSAKLGEGKDREYFETFEGKLIPARRTRARYVRLYSRGSTADEMNHYTEVEVYGLASQ